MRKQYKQILLIMFITTAVVGGLYLLESAKDSPPNIFNTYKAVIKNSENIFASANSIQKKIERVNNLDLDGKKIDALSILKDARAENELTQEEAQKLMSGLEEIVLALNESEGSAESKNDTLQALTAEIAVIDGLLDYTDSLDVFLDKLEIAVETDNFDSRLAVDIQLREVNHRQRTLDDLNSNFIAALQVLTNNYR